MTINIVFDFGAVLFSWRPDLLLAEQFPLRAATPQAAQALQRFAENWKLPQLWNFMSGIGERLAPMPDSVALLTMLREQRDRHGDLRLYFLSNMPAPFARVLEHRHAFLSWFDGGVFSGDVQLIKPDPAIYALLETRYALEPAKTVFVDDLVANVAAAGAVFTSSLQNRPRRTWCLHCADRSAAHA